MANELSIRKEDIVPADECRQLAENIDEMSDLLDQTNHEMNNLDMALGDFEKKVDEYNLKKDYIQDRMQKISRKL